MVDDLVGDAAVVLQDVVVGAVEGLGDALGDGLERRVSACVGYEGRCAFCALGRGTRISLSCSSGMSVSLAPWCFGMMSCGWWC